ncbi:MAG: MFS transporter [Actinomycetes bacterium]
MLTPYRELLATPGGKTFSGAAFVARMPISMVGLGIVLLVVGENGLYGVAGAVSATFALVNAASAPVIARLVDRLGQTTVLAPAVAVHLTFLTLFVVLVTAGAPTWTFYASVAAAACFGPSIGSLVRARWGHVLGSGGRLQTAYAYESVLDELIFVLGPLIVTVLATRVNPQAGLLSAVGLLAVGTTALLAHRASEPPAAAGHEEGHPSALRSPGLPVLMLVMFFIGGVFGSVEISAVAFSDEIDRTALAGPLLACYAGGSALSGLVFGAVHWTLTARRRLLLGASAMTVTVTTLPAADTPGVLAGCLFLAGLGIAPTLISGFSLVERMVPAGTVTEGLTWATTGLIVGFSGATWLSGRLVDSRGVSEAFAVAIGSGLSALVVCSLVHRRLPR